MCDQHSIDDMNEFVRQSGLSRRRFGSLTMGAGLTAMLPSILAAADAKDVVGEDIEIKTPDGVAEAYFVRPSSGRHPGVLVWPDAFGLRPAFKQMADRLAREGYAVLVPNQFYRTNKLPIIPGANVRDEATLKAIFALIATLNADITVADAKAFVGFLEKQPAVDARRKLATTGYCMGGSMTVRTAATFPDRVGAVASFHGGWLVTDKPDSPHLLMPKIKAQCLFAIAQNDDQQQPEAKDVLRDACAKAGVKAEIEVYAALHGWCPPDSPVYDEALAEKAWGRMLVLFKAALA